MQIAVLFHHVADIDADAEFNAPVLGRAPVVRGHGALNFHRAAQGFDDAWELDQNAVAGGIGDAAIMFGNLGIDEFGAVAA